MSTGYDQGGALDSSTNSLVCGGTYFTPGTVPGTSARCNYASITALHVPQNYVGLYTRTPALFVTEDFSWDCWVHPRQAGITYGADVPLYTPWQGGFDSANCPFCIHGASDRFWLMFRDGVGMGLAHLPLGGVGYSQVVVPFPTDMEQWFYVVCNVYRNTITPRIEFWLNGTYRGSVNITNPAVAGIYQPEIRSGTGTNHFGKNPVLGAWGLHNRMLTHGEIRDAYQSRTGAYLGAGGVAGVGTNAAVDYKDTYFSGGIDWTMPTAFYGASVLLPDAYLGDASYEETSDTTFYGALDGGLPDVFAKQMVLSRGRYGPIVACVGAWDQHDIRFGWFDGR